MLSPILLDSGDLRNIRTINELPSDYSGELTVLIDDRKTILLARNIILLLILGCVPDINKAAEYALHVWYSAFLPIDYDLDVKAVLSPFLETLQISKTKNVTFSSRLGQTSDLSGMVEPVVLEYYCYMVQSKIDRAAALAELKRVRCIPA